MKILNKTFSEFLNKIKMQGEQSIDECLFDFQASGLVIKANSPAKQSRVSGMLSKKGFIEYEDIGKIGVNQLDTFIKVLDRFGEKLKIKKDGNLMIISGDSKKVEIELMSEKFFKADVAPELEFDESFKVTASKLNDVFKDAKMNKDSILKIKADKGKVIVSNTGKYKFTSELAQADFKEPINLKFGSALIDCLINLKGNLVMSIQNNYPCQVFEKTDVSEITIIVAPRISKE